MKQKERLVELLIKASKETNVRTVGEIANYLLDNGVVVLPPIEDNKCIYDYLFEADRIVQEYYTRKERDWRLHNDTKRTIG